MGQIKHGIGSLQKNVVCVCIVLFESVKCWLWTISQEAKEAV
jgi:hypothetical protein